MASAQNNNWLSPSIKGLLLDITGVLYDSTEQGGVPIPGSIKALQKLTESSAIKFRLCTNETQLTTAGLALKLNKLGFTSIKTEMIFSPGPAMKRILYERKLRPFLVVYPDAIPDYEGVNFEDPNCVVIGDAADYFTYENMNRAFQVLISKPKEDMSLFSLGFGKYYKHNGTLALDVGPYVKALEFASGIEPEIVGKPSSIFFQTAVEDMQLKPQECVMIGDDIVGDVGGAQKCGLRGVQVRTGKYTKDWENHPSVNPDGFVDDLAQAVSLILQTVENT